MMAINQLVDSYWVGNYSNFIDE